MSELREAIARALCRLHIQQVARYDNPPPSEDRIQAGVDNCWEAHLDRADAALAAIEAGGMVVVPVTTIHGALNKLDDLWDEGPPGEGWQSDELVKIVKELESALPGARTEG